MTLPAALRSFRHRNFRLFAAGQIVSLSGTWMQTVAQSWLVYRLTGSPVLLGLVGFAGQIPVFLLAPAGGIVADRYSRRNIVIGTQAASMVLAFALAALTLSGRVQVPHIFVLAALLGVVNAFDIPARQAFIVEMVEKDDLINAIALNSSLFNSARIVGPAVAGLLVAAIGEGWCFFANGVSYAPVIAGLALIRVPRRPAEGRGRPLLADIVEGFRFVARKSPGARAHGAAGRGEYHRHALRRADAHLRRCRPARRRARAGAAAGRFRRRRAARGAAAGIA